MIRKKYGMITVVKFILLFQTMATSEPFDLVSDDNLQVNILSDYILSCM